MDPNIRARHMKPKVKLVAGGTCGDCDARKGSDYGCGQFNRNVAPCFTGEGVDAKFYHIKYVGEHPSTR